MEFATLWTLIWHVTVEKLCFRHSSLFLYSVHSQTKRKKSSTQIFHFCCCQGLWANKSDRSWNRNVLFSVFVIDLYSADSQTQTIDAFFNFTADGDFGSITRVRGGIEYFCFQRSLSFSISLSARLKRIKNRRHFFFLICCWQGLCHGSITRI